MRDFTQPATETATHMVLGHLQQMAGRFEQYATGLLRSVGPSAQQASDVQMPNCPFMRVALAIGFTPKTVTMPPAPPAYDTEFGGDFR